MKRKNPTVTVDLPPSLHKALKHKLVDEELRLKAVVRQLIELWVKDEVKLPSESIESTKGGISK